jgi:hypothetical protein
LLDSPLEGTVGAVAAFERGFLASTEGQLVQYVEGHGFCPMVDVVGSNRPAYGLLAREDAAFAPLFRSPKNGQPGAAHWLFPAPEEP